ncbi:MAG: CoA-binding protein [Geminicoccaceae bacterium]
MSDPAPNGADGRPPLVYEDGWIRTILERVKTIAMVGASAGDMRPSYFAMLYLQNKGYRVIPVNPRYAGEKILGETVYANLNDVPGPIDMVSVFRRSEDAPAVVDEAMARGVDVIWMQLGVRHDEAAARAERAGHTVVMDRCPKIEYGRLLGEIGWLGVNRGVLSAKKGTARQLKPGPKGPWSR